MILVIDNYDSFTYNLVQAIGVMGYEMKIFRNDKITKEEARALAPDHLILSPGPCTPSETGVCADLIRIFTGEIPILGVCLGQQTIADTFGGEVVRADRLMHGKTSMIEHDGKTIFEGIQSPFEATRYHSLIVKEDTLPDCFEITARTTDQGELMGLRHLQHRIEGVQFHPESFLTPEGPNIIRNFLEG